MPDNTSTPESERSQNLTKAAEIISDETKWIGSSERDLAHNDAARQLEEALKYGEKRKKSVGEEEFRNSGLEAEAEKTYRNLLEASPEAARKLEDTIPVPLADKVLDDYLIEQLDQQPQLDDKHIKDAFAALNEVDAEVEASVLRNKLNTDRLHFRDGERLIDELGREIYDSLRGTSRAFFDYSRRPKKERPYLFHSNWENTAEPARKNLRNPDEIVREEYLWHSRKAQDDLEKIANTPHVLENGEDVLRPFNVEDWAKSVEIANRFDLNIAKDVKDKFRDLLYRVESHVYDFQDKTSADQRMIGEVSDIVDLYFEFNQDDFDYNELVSELEGVQSSIARARRYSETELEYIHRYLERIDKVERLHPEPYRPDVSQKRRRSAT